MAYEPTNWKTGDVVTSQKLNKLEGGVEAAESALFVGTIYHDEQLDADVCDKTFAEMMAAHNAGKVVCFKYSGVGFDGERLCLCHMFSEENIDAVDVFVGDSTVSLTLVELASDGTVYTEPLTMATTNS